MWLMNLKRRVMIIEFEFIYDNDNGLIAHFLDFYAKKSGLEYALNIEANFARLYVIGEEEKLLKFSDEYMNLIPNSICRKPKRA